MSEQNESHYDRAVRELRAKQKEEADKKKAADEKQARADAGYTPFTGIEGTPPKPTDPQQGETVQQYEERLFRSMPYADQCKVLKAREKEAREEREQQALKREPKLCGVITAINHNVGGETVSVDVKFNVDHPHRINKVGVVCVQLMFVQPKDTIKVGATGKFEFVARGGPIVDNYFIIDIEN